MKELQKDFSSGSKDCSYLQYQFRLAQQNCHENSQNQNGWAQLPRNPKIDHKDILGILDQGRDIIITHSSFTPIHIDQFSNSLISLGLKSIIKLSNCQGLIELTQNQSHQEERTCIIAHFLQLNQLEYKPLVIKLLIFLSEYRQKHKNQMNLILYFSKLQQAKVSQIINNLTLKLSSQNNKNTAFNFQYIQIDIPMPFDYIYSDNLLEILQKFLYDQSKVSEKKSVVIFHQINVELKKKLFYLIKTKGHHLYTQLIFESQNNYDKQKAENPLVIKIYVFNDSKKVRSTVKNLNQVYLVLDFQENTFNYFNYQRFCYTQVVAKLSYKEKCKRINLIHGNMGQYACSQKYQNIEYLQVSQQIKYADYGHYCLLMLRLGLSDYLLQQSLENLQIKYCLNALKQSNIINKQNQLVQKTILKYTLQGINPLLANSILQSGSDPKKQSLLMLTQAVLINPSLQNRQQKNMLSAIWHKTGYLQSCLQILVKIMQYQQKPKQHEIISQDELISNFQIQPTVLEQIISQYDKCCGLFEIQRYKWGTHEYQQDDFNSLLQELITIFKPAVGTYSGSRRLGYLFRGCSQGLLASKQCLMSHYNQKPNFILLTKLTKSMLSQNFQIQTCNYIRDDILIMAHGCLPTLSKQSFGQCQLQYLNISSATFNHLSKFNGLQIQIFQQENKCSVQANSDINVIAIQCSKQNKNQINEKFETMLKDIQNMFKNQAKILQHSKTTSIVLSGGGQIVQFLYREQNKTKQSRQMAVVKNLAPEVGLQELKELFDEFIQLKDIKIIDNKENNTKFALVYFYSTQDYSKFYQTFCGCNYYDHCLIVQPYIDHQKFIAKENYLLFQWNMWRSTGQVFIEFQNTQQTKASLMNFKNLAGQRVKVQQNLNTIFASNMNQNVDEKQIAKWVMGQGNITNIQVRRYQPKNPLSEDISIKMIINGAFKQQKIECEVQKIQKGKNGHRSCKVRVNERQKMQQIYFVLNEAQNLVGLGKLYVTPIFTLPIKLPQPDQSYVKVYMDIIKDISYQLGKIQSLEVQLVKQPLSYTLIVKSNSQAEMTIIENLLTQRLKGRILNINVEDSSILFTQLALNNFKKIEKQFPVKIIPSMLQKNIRILCKPSTTQIIQKHINTQIMQSFTYQIPLYNKAFIYLHKNINSFLQQQLKTNVKVYFQSINKKLYLEGNLFILEKVRAKINKFLLENRQKKDQNADQDTICGLCCQQYNHPFKLQGCQHKFCFECLQSSVKVTLQDITLFPIKCPQCLQKIWISDLECLILEKQWEKIKKTTVNQFIFRHPGQYMFCLTTGCAAIIRLQFRRSYNCKQCKKGYCLSCNNLIHPGMTCHQARYGSDRLFSQYMNTIGGRVCANKQCKAPIQRISGCFKVQCSRCKKCMCFKCPPQSMVAYDTPEQTYNHLNRAHGGCF